MKLPLTQSDSTRPIKQADGTLFSFTEHAGEIIAAMNLVWKLSNSTIYPPSPAFDAFSALAKEIVEGKK